MRLTNQMRNAFINAVMNDVPKEDFLQQKLNLAIADAVSQLPPKVRAIYQDKTMRDYLNTVRFYIGGIYTDIPFNDSATYFKLKPESETALKALQAREQAQDALRQSLRDKIHGVAYACKNTKELREAVPEFEKYVPADPIAAIRTLPALLNVAEDFVRAGWPKTEKAPDAQSA